MRQLSRPIPLHAIDPPRLRWAWPAAAMLFAAACAGPVYVTDTQSFVTAGRAAGASASAFFEQARQREIAANVVLVASDPSCDWAPVIYLRGEFRTGSSLCVAKDAENAQPYPVRPVDGRVAPAAAAAIAALAAYVGELAALTPRHEPRFAQSVTEAYGRVETLKGVLDGLGKLGASGAADAAAFVGDKGPKYRDAATAAAEIAGYLQTLAKAQGQMKAIQRIVKTDGAQMEAQIVTLANAIEVVGVGSGQVASLRKQAALLRGTRSQLRATPDFDKRRALLTQLVSEQQDAQDVDAGFTTLVTQLKALAEQHKELRKWAETGPNDKQAAAIRRAQANQVWDILSRLGNLAGAVGGVL